MTEPKRWKVKAACTECARGRLTEDPCTSVVAAADFDRLRDERDWAEGDKLSAFAEVGRAHEREAEARRVSGVLADALRDTIGNLDAGFSDTNRIAAEARSALAVFDTLTEEKT